MKTLEAETGRPLAGLQFFRIAIWQHSGFVRRHSPLREEVVLVVVLAAS